MTKTERKISKLEGRRISLMYNGCDLPDGVIGPREVVGKITFVDRTHTKIKIERGDEWILLNEEIQHKSIKKL